MKRRYKILLILFFMTLVIGISGKLIVDHIVIGLEEVMLIDIEEVDLSSLADGSYIGSYRKFPIEVKVEVKIVDHHIAEIIILKHVSGKGQPAEGVIDDILTSQSLEVDLVAGATYSSKIILLAIYNALLR